MNTATDNAASSMITTAVQVRGVLTRAPKTTYSPVEAGWVEISWFGAVVRTEILVCDRGRGVADYWWGHTFPTISTDNLPLPLWVKVVDCIKGRSASVGAFEATIEVAGLPALELAAAA